jgi:hypothetical protein
MQECEQKGEPYCEDDDDDNDHDEEEDDHYDCVPQRIATATRYCSIVSDEVHTIPTTCRRALPQSSASRVHKNSLLRTLCASISRSKRRMQEEDMTAKQLFKDILRGGYHHNNNEHDADNADDTFYASDDVVRRTDTFSSIPDDVHSIRRVRMMRQMSSS